MIGRRGARRHKWTGVEGDRIHTLHMTRELYVVQLQHISKGDAFWRLGSQHGIKQPSPARRVGK